MGQTPAGWYPNGDQWETYWDGDAWTDQHRPREGATAAPAPDPEDVVEEVVEPDLRVSDGVNAPLLDFVSHIAGRNARVYVWTDRIEWSWKGVLGAGEKAALAVLTLGTSYIATGFTRSQASETIPIRSITSVTAKRGMGFQTVVQVITSGNTIDMRIAHKEAEQVRAVLLQLISGTHPSQMPAAASVVARGPVATAPDLADQLMKLGSLRDAGILTEDEFAAKKAEILARM